MCMSVVTSEGWWMTLPTGDVCHPLEKFLVATTLGEWAATGFCGVEARNAVKFPEVCSTAPTTISWSKTSVVLRLKS